MESEGQVNKIIDWNMKSSFIEFCVINNVFFSYFKEFFKRLKPHQANC